MIRQELARLKTGTRELRQFGWLVGGIFTALGLWFWWRGKTYYPCFLAPGIPLVLLGTIWPSALRRVYIAWMGLALVLGLAVSTTILTLLFYLAVTPIGLAAKLFGKDFLNRKLQPQAKSYWMPRAAEPMTRKRYDQQF